MTRSRPFATFDAGGAPMGLESTAVDMLPEERAEEASQTCPHGARIWR